MAAHNHILFRPLLLLRLSKTPSFSLLLPKPSLSFSLLPTLSHSLSFSSISQNVTVSIPFCSNSALQFEERENGVVEDNEEREKLGEDENESESTSAEILAVVEELAKREGPKLTVKEKKDLCSYANSLGDKLKTQQVGKSGVTNNVVFALSETLESKELLKLKIMKSCPGEIDDVVRHLEQATASVAVGQIGRTVILYRPSLTKLEAEKKKEQARKLFAQKRQRAQAAFMKREQSPRRPGRYQPGNRRSENVSS